MALSLFFISYNFLPLYLRDLLWRDNRVHGRQKPENKVKWLSHIGGVCLYKPYHSHRVKPQVGSRLGRGAGVLSSKKKKKKKTKYVRLQALLFSSPC